MRRGAEREWSARAVAISWEMSSRAWEREPRKVKRSSVVEETTRRVLGASVFSIEMMSVTAKTARVSRPKSEPAKHR